MHAIVIEHIRVGDLPESWRKQWSASPDTHVTIRIEEELASANTDPLFGMWRDRSDLSDVEAYIRHQRTSRFSRDSET